MMTLPAWLKDAVFYEIYPQSFNDANGDGIGDIQGITDKLDYIQSLGCNAIWMNPCFVSPFMDAGYDVADYYKVAPRYGRNADLKRLFREARKRGMRICLDLVPGHTSVEHPWFKESCRAQKNPYTNRYIWTNSVWETAPGMRTIHGYGERYGNYVTNFFWSQPALNYGFAKPDPSLPWQLPYDHPDCRETREEMKRIIRFWLDMGAAGFRVDMAFSLVKKDEGAKYTRKLWGEVRDMLQRDYPEAVLISEWGHPSLAIRCGFHIDFMLHFGPPGYTSLFRSEPCFFSREGKGDIDIFMQDYMKNYRATRGKGYVSIPSSNHDMNRLGQHRSARELKVAFAFLLSMPGVPFIYYGDEIGMDFIEGLASKEGGYNRTGTRTPMQWSEKRNAGFSTAHADKLYLPVDTRKSRPTVEAQEKQEDSLLNTVRRLSALRRDHAALASDGEFVPLYAEKQKYPFVYLRRRRGEQVLVAVNPADAPVKVTCNLPKKAQTSEPLFALGAGLTVKGRKAELDMSGVSCGVWKLR